MAEKLASLNPLNSVDILEKDNTEPSHAGAMSGGRCNDYIVSPTINDARKTGTQWQQWELDIIDKYLKGGFEGKDLFLLLPNRSHWAIRHKYHRLGYSFHRWDKIQSYTELTDTECAYIAGIIDGEGCVRRVKDKPFKQVVITVTNTDKNLIEWLRLKLGGALWDYHRKPYKKTYVWHMTRYETCQNLLKRLLPYLIIKKSLAEDIV